MKLGYIGLGKMGKNMVLRLHEKGIEVVAWNRSPEPRQEVAAVGVQTTETVEELVEKLETPRIIWLMLPAGDVTDKFIDEILPHLSEGDLVIDGGNSFYKDSIKHGETLSTKGVRFMDIGTSGGPGGARNGACLMIGGDKEDYQKIMPIVEAASAPNAFGHFGKVGAGHFAKMVHNGIEYGMMEAIAEGAAILHSSDLVTNITEVFRVYNNQSVIESRLVGWTEDALKEDPDLEVYSSTIGHTGEGEWTIKTAEEMDIKVPVLKDSFDIRLASENIPEASAEGYRNKAVSAMRGKFGGHPVKK